MPKFVARFFMVPTEITVTVVADDEDSAGDLAWEEANRWAETVAGDHLNVAAALSMDGIGADEVFEVDE